MADSAPRAGTKRAHSSSTDEDHASKKRRVRHRLRHEQRLPEGTEPAPQDPVFAQGQLLRSITAALTLAGFDGVRPTALEEFRSHVEEYMLKFLAYARTSMHSGRRTTPTAPDFSAALALMPNTASASLLQAHLHLPIPDGISSPPVDEPVSYVPEAFSVPDFSALLQPLASRQSPHYVPKHFPALPPRHAWTSTPVFPERETDARKMREKATHEGMMAEQALRKLATAAKAGALKAEKRRSTALRGPGKARDRRPDHIADAEDTFADALRDVGTMDGTVDTSMDGVQDTARDGIDTGMPEGMAVNHDMGHWRHGGRRRTLRL